MFSLEDFALDSWAGPLRSSKSLRGTLGALRVKDAKHEPPSFLCVRTYMHTM